MPKGVFVRTQPPLVERIRKRVTVDPVTGCWNYDGYLTPAGYGVIYVVVDDVRYAGRRKSSPRLVHRVMCEDAHGVPPVGTVVRHGCDNRRCCNPAHLSYGTQEENVEDARKRDRYSRGVRHHNSVLTEEQAREIYVSVETARVTADRYGVSESAVFCIWNGYTWSAVTAGLQKPLRRKYSDETIRQIFLAVGKQKAIARRFGCERHTVARIKSRAFYADVTEGLVLPARASVDPVEPAGERSSAFKRQLDLFDDGR